MCTGSFCIVNCWFGNDVSLLCKCLLLMNVVIMDSIIPAF
jgi:hypothetical protein